MANTLYDRILILEQLAEGPCIENDDDFRNCDDCIVCKARNVLNEITEIIGLSFRSSFFDDFKGGGATKLQ